LPSLSTRILFSSSPRGSPPVWCCSNANWGAQSYPPVWSESAHAGSHPTVRNVSRAALANDHATSGPTPRRLTCGPRARRTTAQAPAGGLARGLSRYAETVGSSAR
jgi:hypothetical protein